MKDPEDHVEQAVRMHDHHVHIATLVITRVAKNMSDPNRGSDFCKVCEEEIPEARRRALPGAVTCCSCAEELQRPHHGRRNAFR